jgi:U3 small nucleolar ribonucleoprotein protein IMP4
MPSLLITSSRKTSNRVRSFIRDLSQVIPDSERFNRGGMSLKELTSRITASGANAACVVSMEKGNPRTIQFIDSSGTNLATVTVESAMLRRETSANKGPHMVEMHSISVRKGSSARTLQLAQLISEIFGRPLEIVEELATSTEEGGARVIIWFEDSSGDKTIWTFYDSHEIREIGPRIRVLSVNSE